MIEIPETGMDEYLDFLIKESDDDTYLNLLCITDNDLISKEKIEKKFLYRLLIEYLDADFDFEYFYSTYSMLEDNNIETGKQLREALKIKNNKIKLYYDEILAKWEKDKIYYKEYLDELYKYSYLIQLSDTIKIIINKDGGYTKTLTNDDMKEPYTIQSNQYQKTILIDNVEGRDIFIDYFYDMKKEGKSFTDFVESEEQKWNRIYFEVLYLNPKEALIEENKKSMPKYKGSDNIEEQLYYMGKYPEYFEEESRNMKAERNKKRSEAMKKAWKNRKR